MVELKPIETGEMETCPTAMGQKLRDLIPQIERVLKDADGKDPYALYDIESLKKAIGSSATNPYGFTACLNRLLVEQWKERTSIRAKTVGKDRIMFQFEHEE